MRIEHIAIGENPPEDINVIVEVQIGGEPVKYEMDKKSGTLIVDRILYTSMRYPGNYGFVPHTLSDDGDPVDVLIANHRPLVPGCVVNCRPIGVLHMTDEQGEDEKIIAVPSPKISQMFEDTRTIDDLPRIFLDKTAHFFERYKDLEGDKWVKINGWGGVDDAQKSIAKAIEAAKATV